MTIAGKTIWTLAAMLAVGCSSDPLEAPRGEPVPLEAELPLVDPAALEEPWEALQIEITKDAIHLSHERLCRRWQRVFTEHLKERAEQQSWWERRTDDYPDRIREWFIDACGTSARHTVTKIVALDDGYIDTGKGMMIEPLHNELYEVTSLWRRSSQWVKFTYRRRILVAVDTDVGFETLEKVRYNALQAELSEFGLLVESGDSPKMVAITFPSLSTCAAPPRDVPRRARCADVLVSLVDDGAHVRLHANAHGGCDGGTLSSPGYEWIDEQGEPVSWPHRLLTEEPCPAIGRDAGGYDVAKLAELLGGFTDAEYCGRVFVRRRAELDPGEFLEAVAVISALEQFNRVLFGIVMEEIECEAAAREWPDAEDAQGAEK